MSPETHLHSDRSIWVECRDCGLYQLLPPPAIKKNRVCERCRSSFGHGRMDRDSPLALAITALIISAILYSFPLLDIHFEGQSQAAGIAASIYGLAQQRLVPLALFIFGIAMIAPLGQLLALTPVLLCFKFSQKPSCLGKLLRFAEHLRTWSMLDVLLLGMLISIAKLRDHTDVYLATGFWALAALVFTLALLDAALDRRTLWDRLKRLPNADLVRPAPGAWIGCHACGLVQEKHEAHGAPQRCLRCEDVLHVRKPDSVARTWGLVVAGFLFYIPANIYPILTIVWFGRGQPETILEGIRDLARSDDWPLAIIVFMASIVVPLLKLLGLTWLLLSVQYRSKTLLLDRTRLYRLINLIGRWSTVDLFVAALLTALVTFGNIATVEPGWGALAFGAVVFVTMLAVETFDCRMIWDMAESNHA